MFVASLALSEVVTEAKTSLTGVCQLSSFEVSLTACAEVNIESNFFMESFLLLRSVAPIYPVGSRQACEDLLLHVTYGNTQSEDGKFFLALYAKNFAQQQMAKPKSYRDYY